MDEMDKGLIAVIIVASWFVIGGITLALIDDENESLYRWADEGPDILGALMVMFFPVVLFYWLKNRRMKK